MTWWMGAALIGIYGVYFLFLMIGSKNENEAIAEEGEDQSNGSKVSGLKAFLTFNFNELLFNGRPLSTFSAWIVLLLATSVIGVACWLLAEAVMHTSQILGIPSYITALVLAAAATSVPDTVLSVQDAVRGEYDDAISNAFGSNTFDITVCLGLPLLIFGLFLW